jgi:N-acetylneuraminate synthase
MKAGETLSMDNMRAVRPGLGLAPKYLSSLLGKRLKSDVQRGTPLSWELFE